MSKQSFKNVSGQRLWVLIGICLMIALQVASIITCFQVMRIATALGKAQQAGEIDTLGAVLPALKIWAERLNLVSGTAMVISILYAIIFLVWVYRASCNAGLFEPSSVRITPGWSVGWFFVPVMNLFKPYSIIREIYNSSLDPAKPLEQSLPSIFNWWWGLWIGSIVVAMMSRFVLRGMPQAEDLSTAMLLLIAGTMMAIGALACLWKIVAEITRLQEAKRHKLPDVHGEAV